MCDDFCRLLQGEGTSLWSEMPMQPQQRAAHERPISADLVVAVPTNRAHLPLVYAGRSWRQVRPAAPVRWAYSVQQLKSAPSRVLMKQPALIVIGKVIFEMGMCCPRPSCATSFIEVTLKWSHPGCSHHVKSTPAKA